MEETQCVKFNLYTNDAQKITYTAGDLWNRYTHDKRALVTDFDMWHELITDTTFPEVECVLFYHVNRGVDSWEDFNRALKIWFPNLKTLLLSENYAGSSEEEFIEFFLDPWLKEIWIEDRQTGYNFINTKLELPKDTLRVFREEALWRKLWIYNKDSYEDSYIDFIDEIGIDPWLWHSDLSREDPESLGFILIPQERLQKVDDDD